MKKSPLDILDKTTDVTAAVVGILILVNGIFECNKNHCVKHVKDSVFSVFNEDNSELPK